MSDPPSSLGQPSPERRAAQAVDALRHGWPLAFGAGTPDAVTLLPIETAIASEATSGRLLISAARAATLKLANQREAAVPHAPVLIHGGEPFTLADATPIADPALHHRRAIPYVGVGVTKLIADPEMILPDGLALPLSITAVAGSYKEGI